MQELRDMVAKLVEDRKADRVRAEEERIASLVRRCMTQGCPGKMIRHPRVVGWSGPPA